MSCEHNITFSKYAGIIRDCFAVVATETTHIDQVVNARVIRDLKKTKLRLGEHQKMYGSHVLKQLEKR